MLLTPKHKRKRWRKKECVICGFQDTHPGRHITRVHLPWWLKTKTACWTCRVQEGHVTFMRKHHHESDSYNETQWIHWAVGMVCIIQKDLQLSSCEALRQFVIGNKLYTKNGKFDSEEQLVLAKLSAQLGETIPEDSVTACPPNCTAGLLHWETLAKIIPRMSNQSVIHPQLEPNLPDTLTVNPGNYNTLPGILDSHAHIDQLLFKNKCYSIKQFARENINHPIRIKGIVSNFVHPYRWLDHSHICEDPRIKPSFGIHPRFISTRHSVYKNLNELKCLLDDPKCIGVGEIGLEHHNTSIRSQQNQLIFLQEVFQIIQSSRFSNKTIILHCRDDGEGEAAEIVLSKITEMELSNRHIHRHCFSGSVDELTTWLQTLPNCYFGITKLVIENEKIREAVKEIPLSRLLIESDSPYLSSSPWDIFPVIQEISIIKKIPVPQLIEQCNQNCIALYGPF